MNWNRRLNYAIEWLYLAVIFILPLVFIPTIYTTFEIPKVTIFRSITIVLLILFMLKTIFCKRLEVPKLMRKSKMHKFLIWCGIGFFLFYFLATIFSESPLVSIWGWYPRLQGMYTFLSYLIFGAVMFLELGDNDGSKKKKLQRLIITIFVSSALVSLIAVLQKFIPEFLPFWNDAAFEGRVYGTMGNPNYLGSFLIMVIPLILILMLEKRSKGYSLAGLFLALILNFGALYFTYSRAAYLGLLVSLVLLFWVYAKKKHSPGIFWGTIASILVLIGVVGLINIFGQNLKSTFFERLKFQGSHIESVETRLQMWPAVVKQILARPLTGYGPETFALSFSKFAPANINTDISKGDYPDRAHNEILDIAAQIGIPGLVCYLAFLILLFVISIKKILKETHESSWLYLGLLCGVLALFISNQFGFSVTVLWAYFFLFIAILMRYLWQEDVQLIKLNVSKTSVVLVILAVTFLGGALIYFQNYRLVEADYFYRLGLENVALIDNAQGYIKKASSLQPNFEQYRLMLK